MFIYNVTTHVEQTIEKQWLEWMNLEHIPQIIKTGKFTKVLLFKVITEEDDLGGKSYAVQYICLNRNSYEKYLREDAPFFRKLAIEKFGQRILFFRTELEQISAF
tara:strand:- start:4338 stop:4652 length:315 start_codon:yes stop_codon:yes gene_type:complete